MPRAYWQGANTTNFTTALMVVRPSSTLWETLQPIIADPHGKGSDMDIINREFRDNITALLSNPYFMTSGTLRHPEMRAVYLGNDEEWDAEKVMREVRLVHFSDWPMQKPWFVDGFEAVKAYMPDCADGGRDCRDQKAWLGIYNDFCERRAVSSLHQELGSDVC